MAKAISNHFYSLFFDNFLFVFFYWARNEGGQILFWPNVNCKQINQSAATAVHDLFTGRGRS